MKLRNKKTGEINLGDLHLDDFNSLAELNDEWEDYEEPKEYWFINNYDRIEKEKGPDDAWFVIKLKEIGNYFETKEEAELAVRKLKAWKRLKDKGFRFTLTPGVGSLDITPGKFQIEITADMPAKWFCCDAVQKDLEVCFGGEE